MNFSLFKKESLHKLPGVNIVSVLTIFGSVFAGLAAAELSESHSDPKIK